MSQLARRLTAAVLLAAILAMVAPAGASTLRTQPRGSAVVLGSLWDQLVSWLTGFWAGPTPDPRLPARKMTGVPPPPDGDTDKTPVSQERGVLIDPNG